MRVAFLTSGERVPSSRFRVLQFLPRLRELGHECLVLPCRPDKYESLPLLGFRGSGLIKRWRRWQDLATLDRWSPDVVVLERELLSDQTVDLEHALRQRVRRLILDIDDGLFVINRHKFEALCGLSDHVIAGNELLAARVRAINSRVTVIPTCVDLERYTARETNTLVDSVPTAVSRSNAPTRLGWTGTAANVEYLEILRQPLRRLAQESPLQLLIVAESDRSLRRLSFEREGIPTRFNRWSESSEILTLQSFDIGLMPMPDTEWTRYKCGLKVLQYMAADVPAVASPVGVNSEIIQQGVNGWLASTPDEWEFVLRQLIQEPSRGDNIKPAARRTVAERYSVEAIFPRWLACLSSVATQP